MGFKSPTIKPMDPMEAKRIVLSYDNGSLGGFFTSLMDAIARSDADNRARMRLAYPELVEEYEKWQRSGL